MKWKAGEIFNYAKQYVDEMGEIYMEIESDSTVVYSDYNKLVDIVVPEEALNAPTWLDWLEETLMAMMA